MSEAIAAEIWGELKRFVNTVDRQEAAETVVQIKTLILNKMVKLSEKFRLQYTSESRTSPGFEWSFWTGPDHLIVGTFEIRTSCPDFEWC